MGVKTERRFRFALLYRVSIILPESFCQLFTTKMVLILISRIVIAQADR